MLDVVTKIRMDKVLIGINRLDPPQVTEHFAAEVSGQSHNRDLPGQFVQVKLVSAASAKTPVREIDGSFRKRGEGVQEVFPQRRLCMTLAAGRGYFSGHFHVGAVPMMALECVSCAVRVRS